MIIWESGSKRITWNSKTADWEILYKHSGAVNYTGNIKAVIKSVLFSVRYDTW